MVSPKNTTITAQGSIREPGSKEADSERLAKILIVALALLLRVYGLGWALPNSGRYYSYHPDESVVTGYALTLNPFLLKVDPHFYNYGSLSLILDAILIRIGSASHSFGAGPLPGIPSAGAVLSARIITVAMGTATCLFLYAAARSLYGRNAAIAAAGLYAVAPLAVQHGHWATVDIPATFWITGSLYFAARAMGDSARKFDFLWCGAWAGLAAATKYNAGIVILSGVAALWLTGRERRRKAAFLVLGALGALLLGSPAIALNPRGVLDAIEFESQHAKTGHGNVFADTSTGFIYHIAVSLNWGLTLPLLAIVLGSIGLALWKRRPADLMLLAFALPYYVLIGLAEVKFARYTLPLFPPLFLFAGSLLESALASGQRRVRAAAYTAYGIAACGALLFAVALDRAMARPDTRDEAAAFLHERGVHSVGFATGPWFYSPTLSPILSSPFPAVARQGDGSATDMQLVPCVRSDTYDGSSGAPVEWDADLTDNTDPDAVAVSEFEYADALRIHLPSAENFIDNVARKYPTRTIFGKPLEVFGIRFTKLSSGSSLLPTQGLPHDMLYTNPTTIVFTK